MINKFQAYELCCKDVLRNTFFYCFLFVFFFSASTSVYGDNKLEKLKAAFIYNFAKHAVWPKEEQKIKLIVLGDDKIISAIKKYENKKIKGVPFSVRYLKNIDDAGCCVQMIYISSDDESFIDNVISRYASKPVLLIGESEGFIDKGGMINFIRKGSKQKFQVDNNTVLSSGIVLSSHLLRAAYKNN